MTSLGPRSLLTENICRDRTTNRTMSRARIILAASNVESKNRRMTATVKANRDRTSRIFQLSLKYNVILSVIAFGC